MFQKRISEYIGWALCIYQLFNESPVEMFKTNNRNRFSLLTRIFIRIGHNYRRKICHLLVQIIWTIRIRRCFKYQAKTHGTIFQWFGIDFGKRIWQSWHRENQYRITVSSILTISYKMVIQLLYIYSSSYLIHYRKNL